MDDDRPLGVRRRGAVLKLLGLLLLAVSPLGAPAIGLLLVAGCDIAWMEPVQCDVPAGVLSYFVTFSFMSLMAGGALLAVLWLLAAAGLLLACLVQMVMVIWLFVFETPIPGIDVDQDSL